MLIWVMYRKNYSSTEMWMLSNPLGELTTIHLLSLLLLSRAIIDRLYVQLALAG